jgi:transposase
MKAYSMDLRERIVLARESGESVVSVAQRFGVCTKTVRAYQSLASKGQLSPRPIPGKAARLRPEQEAAFVAMVEEQSDWTLDWTVEQLSLEWERRSGVLLPRSTLHDHMKRLGARFKKRVALPKSVAR